MTTTFARTAQSLADLKQLRELSALSSLSQLDALANLEPLSDADFTVDRENLPQNALTVTLCGLCMN